ncbi:MAG: hypothetical protein K2X93_15815 [Candidatus Obscuribacterales bacterium]|nr:hypothetical protein [Candidatus Obscuribacterales bacterium]
MTTKKTDNNPQPDESRKDQSQSAQPQDELNNFPWLKSLVPQQGSADSPDETAISNSGAPEAEAPRQPTGVQPFPKHSREIARTLIETDISKFSDMLTPAQPEAPQSAQPSVPPEVATPPSDRPVSRTLLETDISQFSERLRPATTDTPVPVSPASSDSPPEVAPPRDRDVARTLMETDISMFSDGRLSESAPVPTEPPQRPTQERNVSRTLLEHEIPQFSDSLTASNEPQAAPLRAHTQEREVSRTLLEHELPQFADSLAMQPDPNVAPHTDPVQRPMPQERNVSRTLLETDISGFADALQSSQSGVQSQLNFNDSQSFSDLQSTKSAAPFPDHSIPPNSGFGVSDPGQQLYSDDPYQSANMTGRNPLPDRNAPKTLLDKEMLLSHLAKPIERLEAAEKQRIETQALKVLQPIENYKMTAPGCPWRWEEARSSDKVAFCTKCKAQAYNFDGMQLPEALKLIFQRENIEKPRLYKREDGKFMTRDCPISAKKRGLPLMIVGGVLILIALIALAFVLIPGGSMPSVSLPSVQEATTPDSSSSAGEPSSSTPSTASDSSTSSTSEGVTSKRPAGGWQTIHKDVPMNSDLPSSGNQPSSSNDAATNSGTQSSGSSQSYSGGSYQREVPMNSR